MRDEINIPSEVVHKALEAGMVFGPPLMAGNFAQEIARWMREECAKAAETYAEDIPDADQDVFHDLGKKIRLIGTNL